MLTCKPCAAQGEGQGRILVFSPALLPELHRASARNRGIFNAEVVHGLQVRYVREGGDSLQPKYSKSAEVVHGLQVRHAREGGRILVFSPAFFHEMHRASARNRGIFNAEVVHGLQVRCTKEGGRQPNGKALKKSRDCAWLTDKRYQRRRASPHIPFPFLSYFPPSRHKLIQRNFFGKKDWGKDFMEDTYGKILWEGYGLKYYGGTRTRTGLICKTDVGLRELKKARSRREDLLFAHEVKTCLYRNGFSALSLFYTAQDGQPFFAWDGNLYLLENPMPTKGLEEDNADDFVAGAALMGQMHRAAAGFPSQEGQEERPALWQRRYREFVKIRRHMERQGKYSPLDLLVMRHYSTFAPRAQEALKTLEDGGYGGIAHGQKQAGTFCHNQFKGSNLCRKEDGSLWVGGFEQCTGDIFAVDLAAYLRRFWRKVPEEREKLEEVLAAYEGERSMAEAERKLLVPLTAFPEKFLRLVHESYNRRRVCVSPAMEERLADAAAEESHMGDLSQALERLF